MMQSIREADELRTRSEIALIESRQERERYIQGMRDKAGDDTLRHIHHDAMLAHSLAMKAGNVCLGTRKVIFCD